MSNAIKRYLINYWIWLLSINAWLISSWWKTSWKILLLFLLILKQIFISLNSVYSLLTLHSRKVIVNVFWIVTKLISCYLIIHLNSRYNWQKLSQTFCPDSSTPVILKMQVPIRWPTLLIHLTISVPLKSQDFVNVAKT